MNDNTSGHRDPPAQQRHPDTRLVTAARDPKSNHGLSIRRFTMPRLSSTPRRRISSPIGPVTNMAGVAHRPRKRSNSHYRTSKVRIAPEPPC
jgi:hypothetical protein